jgi:hypothetical protein
LGRDPAASKISPTETDPSRPHSPCKPAAAGRRRKPGRAENGNVGYPTYPGREANADLEEDVLIRRCKSLLEDQAFQSKLAAWNAKQNIVSYYADHTKLVIVSEGATQDAVIGKCVCDVSWLRRDLAELEESFEPQSVDKFRVA